MIRSDNTNFLVRVFSSVFGELHTYEYDTVE